MSSKLITARNQDLESAVLVTLDSQDEFSLNLVNSYGFTPPIFLTRENMEMLLETLQEFVGHE